MKCVQTKCLYGFTKQFLPTPQIACSNNATIALMRCLQEGNNRNCLLRHLVYYAAPVLRGHRIAVLLTLSGSCDRRRIEWERTGADAVDMLGLSCFPMIRSSTSTSVLLYDRDGLAFTFSEPYTKSILCMDAYPFESGLDDMFAHLNKRFCHGSSPQEFPHEIGLFLGFPPKDVSSFIKFHGKNYLFCGHWKVYHDLDMALTKMRASTTARELAASMLLRHVGVEEIVDRLKAA